MKIWFSNHYYDRTNYEVLFAAVNQYAKAKKSILTHWCNQETVINTARSNIFAELLNQYTCTQSTSLVCLAERSIKTVQEIMIYAKT